MKTEVYIPWGVNPIDIANIEWVATSVHLAHIARSRTGAVESYLAGGKELLERAARTGWEQYMQPFDIERVPPSSGYLVEQTR